MINDHQWNENMKVQCFRYFYTDSFQREYLVYYQSCLEVIISVKL